MSFYSNYFRNLSLVLMGLLFFSCVPGQPGQFSIKGERQYKRDKTAPSLVSISPANEALFVAVDENLVVNFDEEIKVEASYLSSLVISIRKMDESSSIAIQGSDLIIEGKKLTIDPPIDLESSTEYYVQIQSNALKNNADIKFAGIGKTSGAGGGPSWSFTTISLAGFTIDPPVGNTTESGGAVSFSVVLNEAPSDTVVVNIASSDASEASPLTSFLSFTTGNWSTPQTITIVGEDDLIDDGDQGYEIEFTSIVSSDINYSSLTLDSLVLTNEDNDDVAPSLISLSPVNGATGISTSVDLSLTFNENIQKGSGNITIRRYNDNSIARQVAVTHASVSITGATAIIDVPVSGLSGVTEYYVEICSTCFSDLSSNPNYFEGINDKLVWSFTTRDSTAPTITTFSPSDNSTGVLVSADLTLSYSENIKKDDLWNAADDFFFIRRVSDNSLVAAYDFNSPELSIVNNQLRFSTLDNYLLSNTAHYIQISNGAIADIAGNIHTGVSISTLWNFTTEDTSAPTIASLNPAHLAEQVSHLKDVQITFNKPVQAGSGNIYLKKQSDNSTVATFAVPGASVIIGGVYVTIDTSPHFTDLTDYYIEIESGAFVATSTLNASFAGIAANDWSFRVELYKTIRDDFIAPVLTTQILDYSDDRTLGVYLHGANVYLYNFVTNTSTLVSKYANQNPAGGSSSPRISGNGLFVVYSTTAAIAAGEDAFALSDVYRYDVLLNQNTRMTSATRTNFDDGLGDTSCLRMTMIALDLWCDPGTSIAETPYDWTSSNPAGSGTVMAHYSDCTFSNAPSGSYTEDLGYAYTEDANFYNLFCNPNSFTNSHSYEDVDLTTHYAYAPYADCQFSQGPVPGYVLAIDDAITVPSYYTEETRVQYTVNSQFSNPDINQDGSIVALQEDLNDYFYEGSDADFNGCVNVQGTLASNYSRVQKFTNGSLTSLISGSVNHYAEVSNSAYCSSVSYTAHDLTSALKPRVSPDGSKVAYFERLEQLRKDDSPWSSDCIDKTYIHTTAKVNTTSLSQYSNAEYEWDYSTSVYNAEELVIDNSNLAVVVKSVSTYYTDISTEYDLYCHPANEDAVNTYEYEYQENGNTMYITSVPYFSCEFVNVEDVTTHVNNGFFKYSDGYTHVDENVPWSDTYYQIYTFKNTSGSSYSSQSFLSLFGETNKPTNLSINPVRDEIVYAVRRDSTLAPLDSNSKWDVYRSRTTNLSSREILTLTLDGNQFNDDSGNLMLFFSADGNSVQFNTKSSNVVNNPSNENILVNKAIIPY